MKKSAILLFALLIVMFTACSAEKAAETEAVKAETPAVTLPASDDTMPEPTADPTSKSPEVSMPQISAVPKITVETPPVKESTPSQNTMQTSLPQAKAQTNTSAPPKQSFEPEPPPTTSSPPQTDPPPVQTELPAAFGPQQYLQYAISYGQSIGLIYDSSIGTASWNAPQNLYAGLSEDSMKSGIRSKCDRLKREECEYFYPCLTAMEDGIYQLYLYYG